VPRVLVVHRESAEAIRLAARLSAVGFQAEPYTILGPKGFGAIRANPPDAIVIDLTTMPSYGKGMGALLREQKSLRAIPLVFMEGDPEKAALVRALLPDASYSTWAKSGPAIRAAIRRPPAAPQLPTRKPLADKLGIREGSKVAIVHTPQDFRMPEGSWRHASPDRADVIVAFYRSTAALGRELPTFAGTVRPGLKLWIAWPKKAGGSAADLTMPLICQMVAQHGLTAYKVCSVDETWSAVVLAPRRAGRRASL